MQLLPTEGRITQKFHTRVSYIKGRSRHEAVDIVTYGPRPMKALHAGDITKVIDLYEESKKTGYGNEVWIKYETGVEDRYCHCAKGIPVKVGQHMESGQEFAHTGRTGYRKPDSTWHVHWESYVNGKRVDPLTSSNQLTKEEMEKLDAVSKKLNEYIKQTDPRLDELEKEGRRIQKVNKRQKKWIGRVLLRLKNTRKDLKKLKK